MVIRGVGAAAETEAYTFHTKNIISQRQHFAARCPSSYFDNLCVTQYMRLLSFYPQASDVSETHCLFPATVHMKTIDVVEDGCLLSCCSVSLTEVYRRSKQNASCLRHPGSSWQVTSETSVNIYQTTRRNNPGCSHLHIRRHEHLKSRPIWSFTQISFFAL
jgi:hypothetical protein